MSRQYLFYKPRQSLYYVMSGDAKIKGDDGEWHNGKVYVAIGGCQCYCRPDSMFEEDKWEFLTHEQARDYYRRYYGDLNTPRGSNII